MADAAETVEMVVPKEVPLAGTETEPPKRGRGRPKGATNKATSNPAKSKAKTTDSLTPEPPSVESLMGQIVGLHMIIGMYVPGVEITEESAKAEAQAIRRLIDMYGMTWLVNMEPWIGLAITVGIGELPTARAIMTAIRERKEKKGEPVREAS